MLFAYLNETRRSIVMVQYKMMDPLERTKRQVHTGLGTIIQARDAWASNEDVETDWRVV